MNFFFFQKKNPCFLCKERPSLLNPAASSLWGRARTRPRDRFESLLLVKKSHPCLTLRLLLLVREPLHQPLHRLEKGPDGPHVDPLVGRVRAQDGGAEGDGVPHRGADDCLFDSKVLVFLGKKLKKVSFFSLPSLSLSLQKKKDNTPPFTLMSPHSSPAWIAPTCAGRPVTPSTLSLASATSGASGSAAQPVFFCVERKKEEKVEFFLFQTKKKSRPRLKKKTKARLDTPLPARRWPRRPGRCARWSGAWPRGRA